MAPIQSLRPRVCRRDSCVRVQTSRREPAGLKVGCETRQSNTLLTHSAAENPIGALRASRVEVAPKHDRGSLRQVALDELLDVGREDPTCQADKECYSFFNVEPLRYSREISPACSASTHDSRLTAEFDPSHGQRLCAETTA
jgi:hypothetical protein